MKTNPDAARSWPIPVPTARLPWLCAALLVLAACAVAWDPLLVLWEIVGAAFAASIVADLWLGYRQGCPLSVRRTMPRNWPVGVGQDVVLQMTRDRNAPRLRGQFFDGIPGSFRFSGLPSAFSIPGDESCQFSYRAQPQIRGSHRFTDVALLVTAPLGLWNWRHSVAATGSDASVRVYPDFAKIAQYAALATEHRLTQVGLLQRRRRGEGMEFQQLREYREGDTPRQIDWKASARQRKLIARDYQDESNQQVLLLLDCGQRMQTREAFGTEGSQAPLLSHFDHTLNAMLLFTYVALRQGDGVGMATFAHPEPRFVGPRRGRETLNRLLDAVYDLEPTSLVPDFADAARFVVKRLRRRSLIVLLTNLRDEDDDTLGPALALLRRHHLVVVASLREPGLTALRDRPVQHFEEALAYAAATEYLYARQRLIRILRKTGVRCLDLPPAELPIGLVNEYWSMKRGGVF